MEAWVSGLYQQSWKLPNMKVFREFESHRFRQDKDANSNIYTFDF